MKQKGVQNTHGEVITFYSYKGGTGRSMVLANVACILAEMEASDKKSYRKGKRKKDARKQSIQKARGVLIIDWDMEAPGLHRFLWKWLSPFFNNYDEFKNHPGCMDLIWDVNESLKVHTLNDDLESEEEAQAIVNSIDYNNYIINTDIPFLDFIKAGCFNEKYPERVNSFDWDSFHERSPWILRTLARNLAERYRYVLIDSRTGLTDTSGICTMIMPDKLVVVFTPNKQSLNGILDLIPQAVEYRRQSDDDRPLDIFPLPSRIDFSEDDLRTAWQLGDKSKRLEGYVTQFERIFKKSYGLSTCELSQYFSKIQVQHKPKFSYGEEIAVMVEEEEGRLSLSQSYRVFVDWMLNCGNPWNPKRLDTEIDVWKEGRDEEKVRDWRSKSKRSPGKVFISHRHEEKSIADIIKKHLQLWGIPKGDIYQSSDSSSGPVIGSTLHKELLTALTETNLLIFVYTFAVNDWSYCMWEIGVATGPETEPTRLMVFECAMETPEVFQHGLRIRMIRDDIIKFVFQFHRGDNFFPNQPPFNDIFSDDILHKKAEDFHTDLEMVIPLGRYRQKPLIHLIQLFLAPEHVNKISKVMSLRSARDDISEYLLIKSCSPYLPQLLGYSTFEKNMKWSEVVRGWQEEIERSKAKKAKATDAWNKELCAEIWRAIRNKRSEPEGNSFITATKSKQEYVPLLCQMREYPDRSMEFDVYLYAKRN